MEDQEIVALYWARNSDAIAESKEKYGAYCYTVAHNILGSHEDSEECVNDTWLKAWNAMPPHRPNALRMFLAKITRALSLNCFKRYTAKKRGGGETALVLEELSECLVEESPVEDALLTEELGRVISDFVRELNERERNLFIRRYFFTEPVCLIAKRYHLSENNTAVILKRVRKKLKQHLIKEGYEMETGVEGRGKHGSDASL